MLPALLGIAGIGAVLFVCAFGLDDEMPTQVQMPTGRPSAKLRSGQPAIVAARRPLSRDR
jgi:hypothetical protein